jgi:hypothetical protein
MCFFTQKKKGWFDVDDNSDDIPLAILKKQKGPKQSPECFSNVEIAALSLTSLKDSVIPLNPLGFLSNSPSPIPLRTFGHSPSRPLIIVPQLPQVSLDQLGITSTVLPQESTTIMADTVSSPWTVRRFIRATRGQ